MVPFFGIPAATNVATSRLAELHRSGRAPVFARAPAACLRAIESLSVRRSRVIPARARRRTRCDSINFIEAEVRRIPEQYWWIHRRFKGLSSRLSELLRRRGALASGLLHALQSRNDLRAAEDFNGECELRCSAGCSAPTPTTWRVTSTPALSRMTSTTSIPTPGHLSGCRMTPSTRRGELLGTARRAASTESKSQMVPAAGQTLAAIEDVALQCGQRRLFPWGRGTRRTHEKALSTFPVAAPKWVSRPSLPNRTQPDRAFWIRRRR